MSAEVWTMVGVGVVLALIICFRTGRRPEIKDLHDAIGNLRERLAKVETTLEMLKDGKCSNCTKGNESQPAPTPDAGG